MDDFQSSFQFSVFSFQNLGNIPGFSPQVIAELAGVPAGVQPLDCLSLRIDFFVFITFNILFQKLKKTKTG